MCGFVAGFGESLNIDNIINGLRSMENRGPDHQETKIFANAALSHARLAIIDLDKNSNQPFSRNEFYIVYNGEIFNYIELRKELIELGYKFDTASDTEVVLISFLEWGESCLDKFNGMWAFCIYNSVTGTIFAARDRYGIKPFKYADISGNLYFGSTARSILIASNTKSKINRNKIDNFLKESEGVFGEETWFNSVKNLKPGHKISGLYNHYKISRWYDYEFSLQSVHSQIDIMEPLNNAVKLRLRSDVPVAFTLSSGLDSSALVALASSHGDNLKCFSAGINNMDLDESSMAARFAAEKNLQFSRIESDELSLEEIENIVMNLESGHASPATAPLARIYKEMLSEGFKVSIEGQGADELLGGYVSANYFCVLLELLFMWRFKEFFNLIRARKDFTFGEAVQKYFRQILPPSLRDVKFLMKNFRTRGNIGVFTKRERIILNSSSIYGRLLERQHKTTLVSLLHYGDAISMMYSIESRTPFMDKNLVEDCLNIAVQNHMTIVNGKVVGKQILRESMRGYLPSNILQNKKRGFTTPLSGYMEQEIVKERLHNSVHLNKLWRIGTTEIQGLYENKNYSLLWRLLILDVWILKFEDYLHVE